MNVYFVLSEYLETGGNPYGDPPEPPDGGCIVHIVVAKSRGQAKYLVYRAEKLTRYSMADAPAFAVRKIGTIEAEAHVMTEAEAQPWWEKTPEIDAPNPPHRPRAQQGWNPRDVAILGGDPSL